MQQTVIGPLLAALWAQCCCWDSPEDAVYLAIHLGGYCRTSAAMAGALAGGWLSREMLCLRCCVAGLLRAESSAESGANRLAAER